MSDPAILARGLSKSYRVAEKQPGLLGTLRHFLNRQYKLVEAVREIDMTIQPGEVVGFLGANGAGKTTALKMLSGLIHPSAGEVKVLGHTPFDRESAFLRQITLVMGQKQQLLWDLPARDTFRINAAVYQVPQAEADARVNKLAALLEMEDNLDKAVRKLSLGERMKAELIAALLHEPKVLFLDEPTLGLDVNAQDTIRRFLGEHCKQTGATILLTSHYMADITALCERVLIIDKGRIKFDGDLDGITERFAPFRELKLELGREVDRETLAGFGEVESVEGRTARLLIQRDRAAQVVARLMAELPISDLTISDPPIEEVIGRVFNEPAEGEAEAAPAADGAPAA